MIQKSVTIDRVIEFFNEMNRLDPVATSALVANTGETWAERYGIADAA